MVKTVIRGLGDSSKHMKYHTRRHKKMLDFYQHLEPPGTDHWNPIEDPLELAHRIRLLREICRAFRLTGLKPHNWTALDVGCGFGRSTRLLLELGIRPNMITAVDLRKHAIEYARELSPAVNYMQIDDSSDISVLGKFDFVMQCTCFSSIPGVGERQRLADIMFEAIRDNGYMFWWDRIRANVFAGNDILLYQEYFPNMNLLYENKVPLGFSPSEIVSSRLIKRIPLVLLARIFDLFAGRCSHVAVVFQKASSK